MLSGPQTYQVHTFASSQPSTDTLLPLADTHLWLLLPSTSSLALTASLQLRKHWCCPRGVLSTFAPSNRTVTWIRCPSRWASSRVMNVKEGEFMGRLCRLLSLLWAMGPPQPHWVMSPPHSQVPCTKGRALSLQTLTHFSINGFLNATHAWNKPLTTGPPPDLPSPALLIRPPAPAVLSGMLQERLTAAG